MPRLTVAEIETQLASYVSGTSRFAILESIDDDGARVRVPYRAEYLRPGGTLAGPILMGAADTAMYYLLISEIGFDTVAVTSSLNIHFLRRPAARDLVAHARMLKLGRRLAVGEVLMYVDGETEPVAQATVTYAMSS